MDLQLEGLESGEKMTDEQREAMKECGLFALAIATAACENGIGASALAGVVGLAVKIRATIEETHESQPGALARDYASAFGSGFAQVVINREELGRH